MLQIKYVLILVLTIICGCAPLEQAPLMYTSTVTVGVGTGLNTTETPGFDFTLGYKHVDAAYVPVAVSKEGESKSYEVVLIQAKRNDTKERTNKNGKLEYELLENAKENYNADKDYNDQLKKYRASLYTKTSSLKLQKSNIESDVEKLKQQSIDDAANNYKAEIAKKNEAHKKIADEIKSTETEIEKKEKEIKEHDIKLSTSKSKLDKLRGDLEEGGGVAETGDGSKYDAYSVYGSFNSLTEADGSESANTSNTLGKVFSTGVAAQTLAEAELAKVTSYAVSKCFKELQEIISQLEKKPDITKEVFEICKITSAKGG